MYKEDLELDNLQWLICHKIQPNETYILLFGRTFFLDKWFRHLYRNNDNNKFRSDKVRFLKRQMNNCRIKSK